MMNADDKDFFRHIPKQTSSIALDLIKGLGDRTIASKTFKSQSKRELFAEDELVRKKSYDEMRCNMPGQPRSTFLMVFSPDGSKVASTHGNHNIYITDIKSGKNLKILSGHPRTPWCIAFHPTSNQIVASGCLGGEVRIWDLSGGSEVWTTGNQSVIASIAFHPNDRILVIATFNELYFWDWSRPEPFVQVSTANPKEKIRYVAFDKLGHKLITGIANSPQTRWERVRAPVPVPRQAEHSASPYRLRITSRVLSDVRQEEQGAQPIRYVVPSPSEEMARRARERQEAPAASTSLSNVPERERRITSSYRNLLQEYERLVQRYLKIYKPPTMIDRGTDPMESTLSRSTSSATQAPDASSPGTSQPSTSSQQQQQSLVMPSRLMAIKKQPTLGTDTQTQSSDQEAENKNERLESRKHKSSETNEDSSNTKRSRCDSLPNSQPTTSNPTDQTSPKAASSHTETGTQTHSPRKLLIIIEKSRKSPTTAAQNSPGMSIKCTNNSNTEPQPGTSRDTESGASSSMYMNEGEPSASTSRGTTGADLLSNLRPIAEEVKNRFLPIIKSLPACDRPRLLRRFESSRAHERLKFRQMLRQQPQFQKKPNRRPVLDTTSDSTSSDDDRTTNEPAQSTMNAAATASNMSGVRNFIMELEQLLMTILLTEVESNNDSGRDATENTDSVTNEADAANNNPVEDETSGRAPSGSSYSRNYPRRRLFTPRGSAFMPTRVHYNRSLPIRCRRGSVGRLSSRLSSPPQGNYAPDEVVDFAQRPDAEDLPNETLESNVSGSLSPEQPAEPQVPQPSRPDNVSLSRIYSNIVHDLETSLNDVRNIRASNRPGETSDMLATFSASLENIMNQSDAILNNLGGSMSMLPTNPDLNAALNPPAANDQPSTSSSSSVIETDHNYPRHDNMSPIMASLHMTISYIQRQARLLRQQVDSIERIDRAMFEVEQLQMIRQLIMDFLRLVRASGGGESRSSTGMSSVRQMMAGTRISDSDNNQPNTSTAAPSTSTTSTSDQSQPQPTAAPRTARFRKMYPPSRLLRLQRNSRRSIFVNCMPRRYGNRSIILRRTTGQTRPTRNESSSMNNLSSFSTINTTSLNLMLRRLETLLNEQSRVIIRSQQSQERPGAAPTPTPAPAYASNGETSNFATHLGERILTIRLHDCLLRMNRILNTSQSGILQTDSVVVSQDGAARFGARHFLSVIVDSMSKHLDELTGIGTSQGMRTQIQNVLAMALLLCDLLLWQLVDSMPPPAGMNLDMERESLTGRIVHLCGQMLQNRFSVHSQQLWHNLQHMRVIMRQAYRTLGQTYTARRNAMLPNRQDNARRMLLRRYLRNLNGDGGSESSPTAPSSSSDTNATSATDWNALRYLVMRYSYDEEMAANNNNSESVPAPPSPVRFPASPPPQSNPSNNNPTVDDVSSDNDEELYNNGNGDGVAAPSASGSAPGSLYRTNNVNLVREEGNSRTWNVPTVQINDVPITGDQPNSNNQNQPRQRMLYRGGVGSSEMRSFPQISVLRPRFLHPLYSGMNPFDADMQEEGQRGEANQNVSYDCDIITTVTPNHRIQVWDISNGNIPSISNPLKNIIVSECKIHNDASVDVSQDGTLLVTLLPSGGYLNVTNKLGIYSLKWESLGQCLYTTTFEQNAVSVSLSPLSRHLVVGLASRRVSIVPSERWTMARIFIIDQSQRQGGLNAGDSLPVIRELAQNRDGRQATSYKSVNCIRWLPTSGQGLIYATNTGQLVILT